MPQGPNPNGNPIGNGSRKIPGVLSGFNKPSSQRKKGNNDVATRGKYQFVNNGEDGAASEHSPEQVSLSRKACAPVLIALIASLILISQLQLSFETKYEYDYDLSDIKDGGEGESYSFNLWKGAQEVGPYLI